MKVYVSAPWADRQAVFPVVDHLEKAGYVVTSKWHLQEDIDDEQYLEENAESDLEELLEADVLLVLNTRLSEGKAFEAGYFYNSDSPIIVVGARSKENIFYYCPKIAVVPTLEDALDRLANLSVNHDASAEWLDDEAAGG